MNRARTAFGLALIALMAIPPAALAGSADGSFTGGFTLGFRSVDTNGADRKFKEDINLEDGPRLFDFHFDFIPPASMRGFADKVDVSASNLGGDPFETFHLGVRRFGAYQFKYDHRKSAYFYDDLILPVDLSDVRKSNAGDFHTFDFDRVRDVGQLDIDVTQRAKLTFGFERFTKQGESTTTLDLQRDEFELDKPIDESLNTYRAGFQYAWDKATLVINERRRDYENAVEIFLPGFSLGENEENAAQLDFFFLDQPYDFTSNEHSLNLAVRPMEKLDLRFSALLQDLTMDVAATESAQGINFSGAPFNEFNSGSGGVDRQTDQYGVEFTYRATERVAVIGGVRDQSLDQNGDFTFGGVLNLGDWQIDTTTAELGVEVLVSPTVSISGGVLDESRDVKLAWSEDGDGVDESVTTDNTGFFATLGWRPTTATQISLDVEENSFNDPFALASPTDRSRYRLRARHRLGNGFNLSGSYTMKEYKNTDSGWKATTDALNTRLGYQNEKVAVSVGYTFIDVERKINQTLNESILFPIFYEANSDFVDGLFRWMVNERVTLGGSFRSYENDGTFALTRDDIRGWLQVAFGEGYFVEAGYRSIDYDESATNFDDYDADIADLSVGYRW